MERFIDPNTLPVMLNTKEVAGILRCSDTCIYDICKSDPSFPCLRVGRRVLIPRDKFIDWVEQQVEQRKEENTSGVLGAREPFSGYKEAVAYAKLNGKEL